MRTKTLLDFPSVEKIPYFDRPPALGGKLRYLSPEAFTQLFGCTYSESLYLEVARTGAEADLEAVRKRFVPQKHINYSTRRAQLESLRRTPFKKLALCDLGEPFGVGVVALEDIPAHEMIGIYGGVVRWALSEVDHGNDYLSIIKSSQTKENSAEEDAAIVVVDAKMFRGMGGFMLHAPISHERQREQWERDWRNPEILASVFQQPVEFIRRAFKEGRLTDEMISQAVLDGIRHNEEADTEFADIEFFDSMDKHNGLEVKFSEAELKRSIASANVEREEIPFRDTLVTALLTTHAIKKWEMVNINYSVHYWRQSHRYPQLFSRLGSRVPLEFYKRKNTITITMDAAVGISKTFSHGREGFLEEIVRNKPVICNTNDVFSVYEMRKQLVIANAVPSYFGPLHNNSFAIAIEAQLKKLGLLVFVSTFWSNPQMIKTILNYTAYSSEVVMQARDQRSYVAMVAFFAPLTSRIVHHNETREIAITQTNVEGQTKELRDFLCARC